VRRDGPRHSTESSWNPQRAAAGSARSAVSGLIVVVLCSACGKKGPPLPPLLKIPVAPGELMAQRRAGTVDLQFIVPAANTDGTRPANVERVDVYGITGPPTVTDDQILKLGTKVASVTVKAPRDPDATVDPDEPDEEVEPPEGKGLDQGVVARVTEQLSEQALTPVDLPSNAKASRTGVKERVRTERPLLPPQLSPSRTYVGVGISTRGRKGPVSKRVAVPLVPPPLPPQEPTVTYDESTITVAWGTAAGSADDAASSPVLPSRPLGQPRAPLEYNVYEGATKLTKTPLAEPAFTDARVTWGEKRCYAVRTVEKVNETLIESAATPEVCVTLVDTFPPAAPKSLKTVASVGAITLIWEPNAEKDLAGYIVLRGASESDLQPITQAPIAATSFKDELAPGTRHVYAVRAVDKAGNLSAPSNNAEDTAR
jgi:hypothetical protein